MATLATGGRITPNLVKEAISRLTEKWKYHPPQAVQKKRPSTTILEAHLDPETLRTLDLYEQYALIGVIEVCKKVTPWQPPVAHCLMSVAPKSPAKTIHIALSNY